METYIKLIPNITSPITLTAFIGVGLLIAVKWILEYRKDTSVRKNGLRILSQYRNEKQRNEALTSLLGEPPPRNYKKEDISLWIKEHTKRHIVYALLVFGLAALFFLFLIVDVLTNSNKRDETTNSTDIVGLQAVIFLEKTSSEGSMFHVDVSNKGKQVIELIESLQDLSNGQWLYDTDKLFSRKIYPDGTLTLSRSDILKIGPNTVLTLFVHFKTDVDSREFKYVFKFQPRDITDTHNPISPYSSGEYTVMPTFTIPLSPR